DRHGRPQDAAVLLARARVGTPRLDVADAAAQGFLELAVGPRADPRRDVGRDVRRPRADDGQRELAAAREVGAVAELAAHAREILAAREELGRRDDLELAGR